MPGAVAALWNLSNAAHFRFYIDWIMQRDRIQQAVAARRKLAYFLLGFVVIAGSFALAGIASAAPFTNSAYVHVTKLL